MNFLNKFGTGKIKRNSNFYFLVSFSLLIIISGINTLIDERIAYKGTVVTGINAQFIGSVFLIFGIIILYYLIFKAKKNELKNLNFHELENFEDNIDNLKIKFEVQDAYTPIGNNYGTSAFYYSFKVYFNTNLGLNLDIKQRNKIEYFIWKVGISRFFDTLTGNYNFDSRYHVNVSNKKTFKNIFTFDILDELYQFDKEEIKIRSEEGFLYIFDSHITYLEGPYRVEYKIFNPHRGDLTKVYEKLITITKQINFNYNKKRNNNF